MGSWREGQWQQEHHECPGVWQSLLLSVPSLAGGTDHRESALRGNMSQDLVQHAWDQGAGSVLSLCTREANPIIYWGKSLLALQWPRQGRGDFPRTINPILGLENCQTACVDCSTRCDWADILGTSILPRNRYHLVPYLLPGETGVQL